MMIMMIMMMMVMMMMMVLMTLINSPDSSGALNIIDQVPRDLLKALPMLAVFGQRLK